MVNQTGATSYIQPSRLKNAAGPVALGFDYLEPTPMIPSDTGAWHRVRVDRPHKALRVARLVVRRRSAFVAVASAVYIVCQAYTTGLRT